MPYRARTQAARIEDDFRAFAFHTAYNIKFVDEPDPTMRFFKALKYSTLPIRDLEKLHEWHRDPTRKHARLNRYATRHTRPN